MADSDKQGPRKRVAVVAVHGVADQQPFQSARQIADMLLRMGRAGSAFYSPFLERLVRIPVSPLRVSPDAGESVGRRSYTGPFQHVQQSDDLDRTFIVGQIREYARMREPEVYEALLLESTRKDDVSGEADVHVYEMYWGDLSRLAKGVRSLLGELYQITLHLASLSRHVTHAAWLKNPAWRWKSFSYVQMIAANTLAFPVPILNLFLFGLALVVLAELGLRKLQPAMQMALTGALLSLAAIVVVALLIRRLPRQSGPLWALPLWLFAAGTAAWWYWRDQLLHLRAPVFLTLATLAAAAIVASVLASYNRHRPGVLRWSAALLAAGGVLALWRLWYLRVPLSASGDRGLLILFHVFDLLYLVASLSWVVFAANTAAAHLLGWVAVPKAGTPGREAALRARWTARLVLGVSSVFFALLTIVLWAGFVRSVRHMVPEFCFSSIMQIPVSTSVEWIDGLLTSLGRYLVCILAVTSLALFVLLWGIVPVILKEQRSPVPEPGEDGDRKSASLGAWLDNTFDAARWAGRILYAGALVTFAVLPVVIQFKLLDLTMLTVLGNGVIDRLGTIVAGGAIGLIALGRNVGRLAFLPGLHAALDIALDVDNYLREHPAANPKARIYARFASLLRYLCAWIDPISRCRYDAIVIVAHSQGSVIAADILRFLHKDLSLEPELECLREGGLPVSLFTMGCPLRQLYAVRFPHLFEWAATDPDPKQLGVREWLNAYRSGDYVGRLLWQPSDSADRWKVEHVFERPGGGASEFCVGEGAHTHYWDRTAPSIARHLDRLLAESADPPPAASTSGATI